MPKSIAAILLCSSLLAGIPSRGQAPAPSLSPQAAHDLLHELDDAFVSVFEKVAPAVVVIEASKKAATDEDQSFDFYFHSPDDQSGGPHLPETTVSSEGSGFIVRKDGYIYTNLHVVEDAENIDVRLRDNRHYTATLVGSDEHTDIAVLKINATDLPVAELVDSDSVRVGQMCFAIGIPYNLDYSFCRGVVSAKGRGNLQSSLAKPMCEDYIQTDAFINPGNSGGPLFDIDGKVMGMNTLINGLGRGLSFAIPSNMLNSVGSTLIATGHVTHAWLGIQVATPDDDTGANPRAGVAVDTIEANAPGFKSDLRPQDLITQVDGVPILTAHDLQRAIFDKKVGQTVALTVIRGSRTLSIPVVTEALPDSLAEVAAAHGEAKKNPSDDTSYGMEFAPAHVPGRSQTEPVRDGLPAGATVSAVAGDSPASRAGIRPGDVITAVDQKPVTDSARCLELLAAHRGVNGPVLFVSRGGHKGSAVLDAGGDESQ